MKKILIIGVIALVVIGCVLAAGCTSTTTTPNNGVNPASGYLHPLLPNLMPDQVDAYVAQGYLVGGEDSAAMQVRNLQGVVDFL